MEVIVKNKLDMQRMSQNQFEEGIGWISIADSDDYLDPGFLNFPKYYLRIRFDDMTIEDLTENLGVELPDLPEKQLWDYVEDYYDTVLFNDQMAKKIAKFVIEIEPHISTLICQCEFGQSRSAACAAAILDFYNETGNQIFEDTRYMPNRLVYTKLLHALKESES